MRSDVYRAIRHERCIGEDAKMGVVNAAEVGYDNTIRWIGLYFPFFSSVTSQPVWSILMILEAVNPLSFKKVMHSL